MHEIKILKILKRRLEVLKEQAARLGDYAPAYMITEIEEIKEEISVGQSYLKRKLQILREQAAVQGISADPEILISIEGIQNYFEREESK